ncbi:carbohydrate ABC transporter permease [Paenibacillus sp. Soil724D2]|uniref:carbohydrate ABC transporter permease n=1 Tax=Paenibacillus sp. (strain Soil724D2) TaxID=1736392 RepID=UPI000713D243|nr:carbohydrate ABC transporter permease [Paenibacillus sp. Soil724D2]KRE38188.1 ABC transporter permease [Paenibacillus sp. Soil724D2]
MNERAVNRVYDTVFIACIAVSVVLCLIPFIHIIAVSLSGTTPITSGKVSLWPLEANLESYKKVFTNMSMIRSLGFTIFLTALSTVLSMIMTIAAAYPLSKKELKGRQVLMVIIIFTMFFSGGMIPEYILMRSLNLLNTVWSLVLPGLVSAFNLIILISFFNGIPKALEESAEIDGCSYFGMLWRITLRLSMPALATLSLFYAVGRWNGFQDALMYITKQELYPLQLKLYQMIQNSQVNDLMRLEGSQMQLVVPESLKAATVIFSTVPILIVYPWLQRYFVSGVMLGAVKE